MLPSKTGATPQIVSLWFCCVRTLARQVCRHTPDGASCRFQAPLLMTRGVTLALLLPLTGSGKTEWSDSQGKPTGSTRHTQRVHRSKRNSNYFYVFLSQKPTLTTSSKIFIKPLFSKVL